MDVAPAIFLNLASAITGVLDYTDKDAKRMYDKAVKSMFSSDELYDCEPEEMNNLLKAIKTRTNEYR